ncbi:DMT family transporter [Paucibacter sp. APW11]|uniref:DMT family transporter n=1 Tax=Roseateles aquae TaxID=3077235 RepID=A0ABU3PHE4_9BURK|nr:DMT family transporter [Paucibacter sp. APW11]MDT9001990.1 DMT family transporter [Paucibacter sp. APW11]
MPAPARPTTTLTPLPAGAALPTQALNPSLFANPAVLGGLALALTVAIWAGFFISLRAGARAHLAPAELALIRFLPAGLVFAPVLWRRRERFAALPLRLWLSIVAGAGLPYFLVAGTGMRHAPVVDGSTLIPGTIPLFVALLAAAAQGRQALSRWPALLMIGSGVATLLAWHHGEGELAQGYALFLLGSLMWANYTLALRAAKLAPVEAAALISCVSLLLLAPWLIWHPPLGLLALPASQFWLHLGLQGLGVGLVSTLSYSYAIARLGAQRAATGGALAPVLAALLAMPVFGEFPDSASVIGMVLIIAGVIWSQR